MHSVSIGVPHIIGQGGQLTLTRLVPNGARVEQGGFIAEFGANL